jgi:thiamine-monophosphate kinase
MSDGKSPLEHALGDGEDFELLFAVSPDDGRRLLSEQRIAGVTVSHIGECTPEGMWLDTTGRREILEPTGYVHKFE